MLAGFVLMCCWGGAAFAVSAEDDDEAGFVDAGTADDAGIADDDEEEDGDEEEDDDDDEDEDATLPFRPLRKSAAPAGTPGSATPGEAQAGWGYEPIVRPILGTTVFRGESGTSVAANLGVMAGVQYWQEGRPAPVLAGLTRVRGQYVVGLGSSGNDVRVGTFMGPSWGWFHVMLGPDLFRNQYTWGEVTMDPALGVALPLTAQAGVDAFSVFGVVEPSWLMGSDRATVDWSTAEEFGFGHEFGWGAGASMSLAVARLTVSYNRQITAFGVQQGVGVGLKLGG